MTEVPRPKTAVPYFAKSKFIEYKEWIESEYKQEDATRICGKLCDIFGYDPQKKVYSQTKKQNHDRWRKKKASQQDGKSSQ